jgi:hypothetical protein
MDMGHRKGLTAIPGKIFTMSGDVRCADHRRPDTSAEHPVNVR